MLNVVWGKILPALQAGALPADAAAVAFWTEDGDDEIDEEGGGEQADEEVFHDGET